MKSVDRHLCYAIIIKYEKSEKFNEMMKRVLPKDVKFLCINKIYYLEISVCDDDDLFPTEYYKRFEGKWWRDTCYSDALWRIDKFSSMLTIESESDIYYINVPFTDIEIKKMHDDIPMKKSERENLLYLLNSELREYIIEHYWYNRTYVYE